MYYLVSFKDLVNVAIGYRKIILTLGKYKSPSAGPGAKGLGL